jgi:gamma-glutamyltranspeptidase/glutathione hydrolase
MLGEGELIREALDPGSRMGSMMSPLVALDEDAQPVAVAGAAGGSRIRPALLQVLVRMLRGAAPQEAIDAPRLNALPDLVRAEPGFHPEVLAALARHSPVAVAATRDPYFGGVSAMSALGGGADPRRNGSVALL